MNYIKSNSITKFSFLLFTLFALFFPFTAQAQIKQNTDVSATIEPTISDFQFNFDATDGKSNVSQNDVLSYKITYGSLAHGIPVNMTIVADWSNDTAPNGANILDYNFGSASDAYGNTHPVIDITNRTITWNIIALPGSTTDQSVTFQLKTNGNYTENKTVPFTVVAKMSTQYVTMPDLEKQQTYLYHVYPAPTPSTTATPTPTPTTPPQPPLFISDVVFTGISASQATVVVKTNKPSFITINYGTNPQSLLKSITTDQYTDLQSILIDGLQPATKYYLQIHAIDRNGERSRSDILLLTTAEASEIPILENNVVAISSNDNILVADTVQTGKSIVALLTRNTEYELVYRLRHTIPLRSIDAVIRSKNTLGINTFTPIQDPIIATIPMEEKEPLFYSARLKTYVSGDYTISVRIRDWKGNVQEQKIIDIRVIAPLSVYAAETKKPISDARVAILYFNSKTNQYQQIPQELLGKQKNQSFTNAVGELNLILPKGKYRATVSDLGFMEKTVDFELGEKQGQDFPKVYLSNDPFYISSLVNYLRDVALDTYALCVSGLQLLSDSVRFFNIIVAVVLVSFIVLSYLLFSIRTHIHPKHLLSYLLYRLHLHAGKHKQKYLFGLVVDEQNQPLTQVRIELLNPVTNNSITHISTNKTGRFYIRNLFETPTIKLMVTKNGYNPLEIVTDTNTSEGIKIRMEQGGHMQLPLFFEGLVYLAGRFFEISLFISLLLELLFFSVYGFGKIAPFFLLSLFNVFLWIIFLLEKRERNLF